MGEPTQSHDDKEMVCGDCTVSVITNTKYCQPSNKLLIAESQYESLKRFEFDPGCPARAAFPPTPEGAAAPYESFVEVIEQTNWLIFFQCSIQFALFGDYVEEVSHSDNDESDH